MKYWYAVMKDHEDTDWGYGSHDQSEAEAMAAAFKDQGYADAYIAVIDDSSDPVCIDEIR